MYMQRKHCGNGLFMAVHEVVCKNMQNSTLANDFMVLLNVFFLFWFGFVCHFGFFFFNY